MEVQAICKWHPLEWWWWCYEGVLILCLKGGARGIQITEDSDEETVPIPNYEIQKEEIQLLLTQRLKKEDEWLVHDENFYIIKLLMSWVWLIIPINSLSDHSGIYTGRGEPGISPPNKSPPLKFLHVMNYLKPTFIWMY